MKKYDKFLKVTGPTAKRVNKMTGATNLSKYIGESIAKKKNSEVKRTVSKKQAAVSAGKTLGSIAAVASVGGAAKSMVKKAATKKRVAQFNKKMDQYSGSLGKKYRRQEKYDFSQRKKK